jgi:HEAT repeat protein
VPNACNECHSKATPQEMQTAIERWWPAAVQHQARRRRLADAIDEKTAGASLPALRAVIYDRSEAAILRGAAALLLSQRFPAQTAATVTPLLSDPDVLVRTRFIEALGTARARSSSEAIAPSLNDPELPVRQMAAMVLASFGDQRGITALRELAAAPDTTTLPRPHLMLANVDLRDGNVAAAESELRAALATTPYLPDALVMLADIEIRRGDAEHARAELEEALRFNPQHEGARKRLALMAE